LVKDELMNRLCAASLFASLRIPPMSWPYAYTSDIWPMLGSAAFLSAMALSAFSVDGKSSGLVDT
jgi:hypothetical protein